MRVTPRQPDILVQMEAVNCIPREALHSNKSSDEVELRGTRGKNYAGTARRYRGSSGGDRLPDLAGHKRGCTGTRLL